MIIDSSAILSILFEEPDRAYFAQKIQNSRGRKMSVATLLESTMVAESRTGRSAGDALDEFVREADIAVVEVTREQIEVARQAWRRFGKGNHPAHLNFGDCFSYALAKTTGESLLFKGNDFAQTDIEPA